MPAWRRQASSSRIPATTICWWTPICRRSTRKSPTTSIICILASARPRRGSNCRPAATRCNCCSPTTRMFRTIRRFIPRKSRLSFRPSSAVAKEKPMGDLHRLIMAYPEAGGFRVCRAPGWWAAARKTRMIPGFRRKTGISALAVVLLAAPAFGQAPSETPNPAQDHPAAEGQPLPDTHAAPDAHAAPDSHAASHAAAPEGGFKRTPAPADAYVYIGWPNDGETIRSSHIRVWFGTRNFGVAPAGTYKPNTGHHHLLVDTDLPPLDQPIPNDKNHLHFGLGQTETVIDLPPGTHTL